MQTTRHEFQELLKCWLAMPRASALAPTKSAFNPRSIPRLLPYIFLLRLSEKNTFQLRLMGTELETALGGKKTCNRRFISLTKLKNSFFHEFIEHCSVGPCAGFLSQQLRVKPEGRIKLDLLAVPLADKKAVPRFILGVGLAERAFRGAVSDIAAEDRSEVLFKDLSVYQKNTDKSSGRDVGQKPFSGNSNACYHPA